MKQTKINVFIKILFYLYSHFDEYQNNYFEYVDIHIDTPGVLHIF